MYKKTKTNINIPVPIKDVGEISILSNVSAERELMAFLIIFQYLLSIDI